LECEEKADQTWQEEEGAEGVELKQLLFGRETFRERLRWLEDEHDGDDDNSADGQVDWPIVSIAERPWSLGNKTYCKNTISSSHSS
jgi:hypothetical protein